MQCLSRKNIETVCNKLFVFCKSSASKDFITPIFIVIEDRVFQILEVDPDLMCSSGFKLAFHQGDIPQPFQNSVVCNGIFSLVSVREYHHFFPVLRIPSQMARNGSLLRGFSPNKCIISSFG